MPFERGILEIMRPSVLPWVHTYFENGTCGRYYSQQNLKAFFDNFFLLRFISNSSSPSSIFFIRSQFKILLCPWLKSGFYGFRLVLGGYLNVLITTGSGYFKDSNFQELPGFMKELMIFWTVN